MEWVWGVGAIVGMAVYLVVFELLVRYVRRNGRDHRRLHNGPVGYAAALIGFGVGALVWDPVGALVILALAIPVTAFVLFWYRKFPCPVCTGALVLLRDARGPHTPRYRCADCGRGFHTAGGYLAEDAPSGSHDGCGETAPDRATADLVGSR